MSEPFCFRCPKCDKSLVAEPGVDQDCLNCPRCGTAVDIPYFMEPPKTEGPTVQPDHRPKKSYFKTLASTESASHPAVRVDHSVEMSQQIYPDTMALKHDVPEDKPLDEAITSVALPSTAPHLAHQPWSADEAIPGSISVEHIIVPTQAFLRTERDSRRGRHVMAALTSEAIWIQDVWQIRAVPLSGLSIDRGRNDKELVLTPDREGDNENLTLVFTDAGIGKHWLREVPRQQQLMPNAPPRIGYHPEGVSLVWQVGDVPHVVVGKIEFLGQTSWVADRGSCSPACGEPMQS